MEIYQMILTAIREYLREDDYKTLFLTGGCYWFARLVASWVPNSYLMINRTKEHCAVVVEQRLCDITGPISKEGYIYAEEKELNYMKKHYLPQSNLNALETYINARVKDEIAIQRQQKRHQLNCNH